MRRAGLWMLIVVLLLQSCVLVLRIRREPHIDEIEMLHSGWLMANGARIYETFFQHHSPLLPAVVSLVAPHEERVDAQPFAVRARAFAGVMGLAALAALALTVWRIDAPSAAIAPLAMFCTGGLWLRIIADVRAEPFAMAFLWSGVALLVLPRKHVALLAGIGVGFVAIAQLWTPKWPLCALVLGIYAMIRSRRRWYVTVGVATGIAIAALAMLHLLAPLDEIRFFVFELNGSRAHWPRIAADSYRAFQEAPALFGWLTVMCLSILIAAGAYFERRLRSALLFVALFVAAVLEIRFIHPYPAVGSHNYAMWAFNAAAILACLPSACVALLSRLRISAALQSTFARSAPWLVVLLLLPNAATQLTFARADASTYWRSQRMLAQRLRPGDTVWTSVVRRHPITVRDAHYYWFGMEDWRLFVLIAAARETERGKRYLPPLVNFPFCATLHGEGRLRFAAKPMVGGALDTELPCFDALQASNRIRPTPLPHVVEVVPQHGVQR